MALKRSLLKGMGLTEEQMDSIIEAHAETVDGLKADLAKYKQDSETLTAVQKELDTLKAQGDGGLQARYDALNAEFDAYKADITAKQTRAAKAEALQKMLADSNILRESARNLIGKSYDLDRIEFDENGTVKGRESLIDGIRTEYADFIGEMKDVGTAKNDPPSGGSSKPLTVQVIRSMSEAEINANWAEVSKVLNND